MKIRRMFISLVAIVVALYAVLLFAAFFGQRKLIYPIPSAAEPSLANGHIERFAVPGVALGIALYAPARSTGLHQPTIVHFHGNGEDLAGVASLVQMLHASGLGVYAVEYPGYGLARPGAPSESAIFATAQAAIEHLVTALGVPRQSIVLEGQSLGTGVAGRWRIAGSARV